MRINYFCSGCILKAFNGYFENPSKGYPAKFHAYSLLIG